MREGHTPLIIARAINLFIIFTSFALLSFDRQEYIFPRFFCIVLNFPRRGKWGGETLYPSKNRLPAYGKPAPKLCCTRAALHFNWITPVYISGAATYDLLKSGNVDVPKFPENYASPGGNKGVPPFSRSFLSSSVPRPSHARIQTYDRFAFKREKRG